MTQARWSGYRNVFLIISYMAWSTLMTLLFEPPEGRWTPELISAVGMFLGTTGATLVLGILGRAANKWAERTPCPEESRE